MPLLTRPRDRFRMFLNFKISAIADLIQVRRDDEVLQYLENYSQSILPYIQLQTLIKRIYKQDRAWIVESASVSNPSKVKEESYDAICDCSGHYTQPFLPYIKYLWRFKQKIMHAKWYRTPNEFEGQASL